MNSLFVFSEDVCYNNENRPQKTNEVSVTSAPIPIPESGAQKRQQQQRRRKKKRTSSSSLTANTFADLYTLTGEFLGEGAYASVQECKNNFTGKKYAVKVIDKIPGHNRSRVFREIEIFYHCQGHKNIIQLVEFFEEPDKYVTHPSPLYSYD